MPLKLETTDMSIPQRIAAIPAYVPSHTKDAFKDAAPGHKFLGYFRNWQGLGAQAFAPYKGKAKLQGLLPPGPQRRAANDQLKNEYDAVLNEVCELGTSSKAQIAALRARQQLFIQQYGASGYRISTVSTAPFATGLGNEHPIENGFAFLTPYGLPYLAGSGVKGILRRAMQELEQDGEEGFSEVAIDALFGPENISQPEDARRGALDFWDVFPNPAGGKLVVEIMTPHFGKYYQAEDAPHESGAPVPVSFLAVPAKSQFDFYVVCQPGRLPDALQTAWRNLLNRAFRHAFEWVGFGAKTSVGYGAMAAPPTAAPVTTGSAAHAMTAGATPDSIGQAPTIWLAAKLVLNPGTGEIVAAFDGQSTVGLKKADSDKLRLALGEERANKLKKTKELKGVALEVRRLGNSWQIIGLVAP
jgi:CRISPR-associated protein Cmr6